MKLSRANDSFPFTSFRTTGAVLILLGILDLAAGIFDVIWTSVKYTSRLSSCSFTWNADLVYPCNHSQLVWTWASCGIWGGVLILLAGIVGSMFSRWRTKRLRVQRDMFTVSCGLLFFPVCPAVITVTILQLIYQKGIFYRTINGTFELEDKAKLVVPLIIIGLTFVAWIVAIAGMAIGCCCAELYEDMANLQTPAYAIDKPLRYQQPGFSAPLPTFPASGPTVELVGMVNPYTGLPVPLPMPHQAGGPPMLPPPPSFQPFMLPQSTFQPY